MNFTDSLRNDVATRHRINDINCLAHAFNLADEAREHLKQAATAETTHLELHWTVDADETWLTDVMDNLLKWLDRTPQPDALAGYCGDSCDEPCTNRHMREWFINQVFDQPDAWWDEDSHHETADPDHVDACYANWLHDHELEGTWEPAGKQDRHPADQLPFLLADGWGDTALLAFHPVGEGMDENLTYSADTHQDNDCKTLIKAAYPMTLWLRGTARRGRHNESHGVLAGMVGRTVEPGGGHHDPRTDLRATARPAIATQHERLTGRHGKAGTDDGSRHGRTSPDQPFQPVEHGCQPVEQQASPNRADGNPRVTSTTGTFQETGQQAGETDEQRYDVEHISHTHPLCALTERPPARPEGRACAARPLWTPHPPPRQSLGTIMRP